MAQFAKNAKGAACICLISALSLFNPTQSHSTTFEGHLADQTIDHCQTLKRFENLPLSATPASFLAKPSPSRLYSAVEDPPPPVVSDPILPPAIQGSFATLEAIAQTQINDPIVPPSASDPSDPTVPPSAIDSEDPHVPPPAQTNPEREGSNTLVLG